MEFTKTLAYATATRLALSSAAVINVICDGGRVATSNQMEKMLLTANICAPQEQVWKLLQEYFFFVLAENIGAALVLLRGVTDPFVYIARSQHAKLYVVTVWKRLFKKRAPEIVDIRF